jgi:hypothetical protein
MFSRISRLNVWPSRTSAVPSQLLPTITTSRVAALGAACAAAGSTAASASAVTTAASFARVPLRPMEAPTRGAPVSCGSRC